MPTAVWILALLGLAQPPSEMNRAERSNAEVAPLLEAIRSVGVAGAGQQRAVRAWRQLAQAPAGQLPAILAGMDGANPLATNWLRMAIDAVAERTGRQGQRLPAAELERLVRDGRHATCARRTAYELLLSAEPGADRRLLPAMLDDPCLELRRDAVAAVIQQATVAEQRPGDRQAIALYRRALAASRDHDQAELIAARLAKLGQPADLARHFGFVQKWKVLGPFDNRDEKGLDAEYPPERELNFAAGYPGKRGTVRWLDCTGTGPTGQVDLNKPFGEQKAVTGYAAAEFLSDRPRAVEIRMSSVNATKLWVNGRLAARFPVYHAGFQWDQYVVPVVLTAGRNWILMKVCQNEQTQEWARVWGFQLRICDQIGGAVWPDDKGSVGQRAAGSR
jgi:hypothetical protein